MSRTSSFRTALLAGVILSVRVPYAQAQSIDYGSFEQMFGEPVTASVTGSPERASEAPAAISIVTQDDIRRSGADNIPDVLQFVTGIDVLPGSFGQNDVAVRGYDSPMSPRLLVLVNGRQVYLDDYGYTNWNAIPVALSEIRQIEIVKGPASALFGFNAAAGVINIITFDPLLDSTNTATVRGGTQHLGEGEAVITLHPAMNFGVRVSASGYTAEDYGRPPGIIDYPSPRNGRLNVDARWQVAPRVQLRAQASLVDNRYTDRQPLPEFYVGQIRSNDVEFGAAAETHFGTFDLDMYRNATLSPINTQTADTNITKVIKLSDLLKVNTNNTLRLGLEYRDNYAAGILYNGSVYYHDYAASLMWSRALSPKLTLVNAARIDYTTLGVGGSPILFPGHTVADYNNTTITAPSFNSGLVYLATPKDTVRFTFSRGLQMPSLVEFDINANDGPIVATGAPNLRPTAVWNADLGYSRDLTSLLSTLTADVFLQRNVELDGLTITGILPSAGNRLDISFENEGSSNEAGLEIGIKGKSDSGLRWNASYQLYGISQDIRSNVLPTDYSNYNVATPANEIIAGIGYTLRRLEVDLNARWQSGFQTFVVTPAGGALMTIGNYVTMMARIGYHITPHITAAGTAEQFNLARIRESGGLPVDRRFIASLTVHF